MTETGPRTPSGDEPVRDLTPFAAVDAWVFDLDNTLYPRHTNLFAQVDARIRDYVQRLLEVDADEAHRVQKDYYQRYGTTLRGLMEEHGIAAGRFPRLCPRHRPFAGRARPGAGRGDRARCPAGSSSSPTARGAHAEKVAARLGFTDHFEDIFDIVRSELLPKPDARDL